MKVALIIDSLSIGGAQKHVRQLACGLAQLGHEATVYVLNPIVEDLYLRPLRDAGICIVRIGRVMTISGVGVLKLACHLSIGRFDAVISVLFASTLAGRIAAQIAGGIPHFTSLQARNINYSFEQKWLVRLSAPLNDFTFSNSRAALLWSFAYEGVDPKRSVVWKNIVDPPKVRAAAPDWRQIGIRFNQGDFVIGSLGRLESQKGYDLLLEALALLPRNVGATTRVVIFGEGSRRKELEALRKSLGLDEMVFFPGQRADARSFLRLFHLYVQPSRFEGTPNALTEALEEGIPAIASAVDGILEMHRETGGFDVFWSEDVLTLSKLITRHWREKAQAIMPVRQSVAPSPNETLVACAATMQSAVHARRGLCY